MIHRRNNVPTPIRILVVDYELTRSTLAKQTELKIIGSVGWIERSSASRANATRSHFAGHRTSNHKWNSKPPREFANVPRTRRSSSSAKADRWKSRKKL